MVEIAPGIVVDPAVRFGKPVIKGTRVPVTLVLAKLSAAMPMGELAQEYGLTIEDIQAALRYAAVVVAGEEVLVAI